MAELKLSSFFRFILKAILFWTKPNLDQSTSLMKMWGCQSVIVPVCMHRCQRKSKIKAGVYQCREEALGINKLLCSYGEKFPKLTAQEQIPFQKLQKNLLVEATHIHCSWIHTLLFRKGITLSIIVDRCSLQERDWKSSMHSREETEWGSKLWIIIGDVAIPKISTTGNSRICWLDHRVGRGEKT